MNRYRKVVAALCTGLIAALVAYFVLPARMVGGALIELNIAYSGLSKAELELQSGGVHYLQGGKGETVIFVHGVYGRKEHWAETARHLRRNYRVVLLDLPGFGENPPLPPDGYRLENQLAAFSEIIDGLDTGHFHIAANSMGAQIAVTYAASYPDRVKTLALIGSPLGVATPKMSDMDLALIAGERPLVVESERDFEDRNAWLFPSTPRLPRPVLKLWAMEEASRSELNKRIWVESQDLSGVRRVDQLVTLLDIPVLVLWCHQDRIFHISGADVLDEKLAQGTVVRMDGCGHVPMLDQPSDVVRHYRAFLSMSRQSEDTP